jgi:hypothetical protein
MSKGHSAHGTGFQHAFRDKLDGGSACDATSTWSRAFVALLRGRRNFDAICMPPAAPRP